MHLGSSSLVWVLGLQVSSRCHFQTAEAVIVKLSLTLAFITNIFTNNWVGAMELGSDEEEWKRRVLQNWVDSSGMTWLDFKDHGG